MADPREQGFAHCRSLLSQFDKDRYWASLYAPAHRRDALYALYAFDLEIRHVAAVVREPMAGEIRLQWWREVVDGQRIEEAAAHPVAMALLETIETYGLPRGRLTALIDARGLDLYDEPFDVDSYSTATTGAVFALAAKILGGEGATIEHLARHAAFSNRAHREAAASLLPQMPADLLPAFLPAATLARSDLPAWRRQYLIWRAARNPRRIFA
jgi:phytoene/squalene synthetase